DPHIAVFAFIGVGKMSLMGIRHPLAVLVKFISPGIKLAGESTARGELPLRFGRQTLPGPFCESQRVLVCDVYNGIGLFPFEVAFRTEWVTPVSTRNVVPPLIVIIERDGVARRREDNGASNQVLRRRAREVLRARLTFSDRDVTGSANKLLKLRIRDVGRI